MELCSIFLFNTFSDIILKSIEKVTHSTNNPYVYFAGQMSLIELSYYWLLDDFYLIQQMVIKGGKFNAVTNGASSSYS